MEIVVLVIVVDLCLRKLLFSILAACRDGDDSVIGAQCLSGLFGDVLRHGRVVAAGHIDQQYVIGAENIDKEGSRNGAVDAAGKPDGHFADAGLFKKPLTAIAEAVINFADLAAGVGGDVAGVDGFGFAVPGGAQGRFFVHGRVGEQPAVGAVDAAAAVEGKDVFAVVLDADIIAVDERDAGFAGGAAEKAVPFAVFVDAEGRAGYVA